MDMAYKFPTGCSVPVLVQCIFVVACQRQHPKLLRNNTLLHVIILYTRLCSTAVSAWEGGRIRAGVVDKYFKVLMIPIFYYLNLKIF